VIYAALMVLVLAWTLMAGLRFVSGLLFPGSVAAGQAAEAEPVIIVDSAAFESSPGQLVWSAREAAAKAAAREDSPLDADPAPFSAVFFPNPEAPGRLYLQVAVVNPELAEVFAAYLSRRDLPATAMHARDGKRSWVLAGPLRDGEQMARIQNELAAAGFVTY